MYSVPTCLLVATPLHIETKVRSTSSAPQKKWKENGKPLRTSPLRANRKACHGDMVLTIGMPCTSHSWPAGVDASPSCTSIRSTLSRSTRSLATCSERLGSLWLSLTTISTARRLPPATARPSFSSVRMRARCHSSATPKGARGPDSAVI